MKSSTSPSFTPVRFSMLSIGRSAPGNAIARGLREHCRSRGRRVARSTDGRRGGEVPGASICGRHLQILSRMQEDANRSTTPAAPSRAHLQGWARAERDDGAAGAALLQPRKSVSFSSMTDVLRVPSDRPHDGRARGAASHAARLGAVRAARDHAAAPARHRQPERAVPRGREPRAAVRPLLPGRHARRRGAVWRELALVELSRCTSAARRDRGGAPRRRGEPDPADDDDATTTSATRPRRRRRRRGRAERPRPCARARRRRRGDADAARPPRPAASPSRGVHASAARDATPTVHAPPVVDWSTTMPPWTAERSAPSGLGLKPAPAPTAPSRRRRCALGRARRRVRGRPTRTAAARGRGRARRRAARARARGPVGVLLGALFGGLADRGGCERSSRDARDERALRGAATAGTTSTTSLARRSRRRRARAAARRPRGAGASDPAPERARSGAAAPPPPPPRRALPALGHARVSVVLGVRYGAVSASVYRWMPIDGRAPRAALWTRKRCW